MSGHQIVLITGAGGGIGAAAARAFAADGHAVAAADINGERLAALEARSPQTGCSRSPPTSRDRASVEAMVARTVERFGAIDVLCPNAGVFVGPDRPLEETPDDAIDLLIDVNIRGVVNVLRAGLPHVRPGGAVILTSSISGLQAHPGGAVYAATKTAQLGLARSLAAELGAAPHPRERHLARHDRDDDGDRRAHPRAARGVRRGEPARAGSDSRPTWRRRSSSSPGRPT